MYILSSHFDSDMAVARVSELLALGESLDRLAEKLHVPPDHPALTTGIKPANFKKLLNEMEKIVEHNRLQKQIEAVRGGQKLSRFLGKGYAERQVVKLQEEQRKLGSLLEAPRWFYKQERTWLLSAIRDYALDTAKNMEADWIDSDDNEGSLKAPIALMFERGDAKLIKAVIGEMDKPLRDVDPLFVLQQMDGHRSLVFNFKTSLVTYFEPVRETHQG
jgi:hypothetical protein